MNFLTLMFLIWPRMLLLMFCVFLINLTEAQLILVLRTLSLYIGAITFIVLVLFVIKVAWLVYALETAFLLFHRLRVLLF